MRISEKQIMLMIHTIFYEASPDLMTLSNRLTLFVLIAFLHSVITLDLDFPAVTTKVLFEKNEIQYVLFYHAKDDFR